MCVYTKGPKHTHTHKHNGTAEIWIVQDDLLQIEKIFDIAYLPEALIGLRSTRTILVDKKRKKYGK